VGRYEGIMAQLLGDGVLAFFGASVTHEDDPERAVRGALDTQEAIADYAAELGRLSCV
jgi:class 3 adenylate cyclase